jgi:DNA-binding MarR family transcriptional regulator
MAATLRRDGSAKALPIDDSLFFKLVRLVNLTARPFMETFSREHRLSLNEWRVMIVLASHPGVAAREVVDATGLDKMSVSRAIAALARHRRVDKQSDPADARRTLLCLSRQGLALFEAIGHQGAQREAALFSGLASEEHAALARIIDRLIAGLDRSVAEQA